MQTQPVVACVLVTQPDGTATPAVRPFGTMTADLAALSDWLGAQRVEWAVPESAGVCWWPVFTILEEGGHDVVRVNPHPSEVLRRGDELIVAGLDEDLERLPGTVAP